jgi:CheY-like chemotaxis protein
MTDAAKIFVLVVEDEDLVREVMVDTLQEEGFGVLQASDGELALQVLEEHSEVLVVVTDLQMPGLTGVDLAREARRKWPWLRFVITSGRAMPGGVADGTIFVPKPWTAQMLIDEVWQAVNTAQAARQRFAT